MAIRGVARRSPRSHAWRSTGPMSARLAPPQVGSGDGSHVRAFSADREPPFSRAFRSDRATVRTSDVSLDLPGARRTWGTELRSLAANGIGTKAPDTALSASFRSMPADEPGSNPARTRHVGFDGRRTFAVGERCHCSLGVDRVAEGPSDGPAVHRHHGARDERRLVGQQEAHDRGDLGRPADPATRGARAQTWSTVRPRSGYRGAEATSRWFHSVQITPGSTVLARMPAGSRTRRRGSGSGP